MTPARGKWMYSLLAKLEKPLHQDMSAMLRQLYRRCSILRYELTDSTNNRVSLDDELAVLNVLISITGSYFGQGEEYFGLEEVNDNNEEGDDDDNREDSNDDSDSEDDYDFGDEGWEEVVVENMDYDEIEDSKIDNKLNNFIDNNNNINKLEECEKCNCVLDIL
jgi:hypothetical protein